MPVHRDSHLMSSQVEWIKLRFKSSQVFHDQLRDLFFTSSQHRAIYSPPLLVIVTILCSAVLWVLSSVSTITDRFDWKRGKNGVQHFINRSIFYFMIGPSHRCRRYQQLTESVNFYLMNMQKNYGNFGAMGPKLRNTIIFRKISEFENYPRV